MSITPINPNDVAALVTSPEANPAHPQHKNWIANLLSHITKKKVVPAPNPLEGGSLFIVSPNPVEAVTGIPAPAPTPSEVKK